MNHEASFLKDPTVVFMTELLADVKKGIVQLPRFQRASVWTEDQRLDLLDSVRKGIPIGAIMLWRTNMPVAARRWIGPHWIPAASSTGSHQYILDGGQRIASLLGALYEEASSAPGDDDGDAPGPDEVFSFYYDLKEECFVPRRQEQKVAPYWLPLPDTLNTVALLKFQRGLTGPDADEWVARADALATRFRAYKVPVILLASDDVEFATTTFRRVNSTATPMSDLDMVSALVWSPTFDLEKLLREERERLEPPFWQKVDDETWLRCIKAILGLDLYADTDKVQRALSANPDSIPRSRDGLNRVAEFLCAECRVASPELVPYRHQIPLLVQAFAISPCPDANLRKRLAAWFWLTTYAGIFSGISGGGLTRAQSDMEELARDVTLRWPKKAPFKREPMPIRFDFRHARARALATSLARERSEGPVELGLYGAAAMVQLVTTGAHRSSPGNRFFSPHHQRKELVALLRGNAEERRLHHVSDAAWEAFEANAVDDFVRRRTLDLEAMEEEFVRGFASLLVPGVSESA
ncbi:MAG: DUF262 domain-containing protein [Myxococcales bacterium]|nr:DUF262 domain-containing protein [Myxococcales bacterium]